MAQKFMAEITRLLWEIQSGNRDAESELVAALYPDLHRIAARLMKRERTDHTLQTTALLNQAYLRLVEGNPVNFLVLPRISCAIF
jgi:DNA-directed RNA polymerase specialized sigma24 family protein